MVDINPEFAQRLHRIDQAEQQRAQAVNQRQLELAEREHQASIEALQLGRRYASILRAANIPSVDIRENPNRPDWHEHGSGTNLSVTGQAWVLRQFESAEAEGWPIYIQEGLSVDGEVLTNFGKSGIKNPKRQLGNNALLYLQREQFLDAIAWVSAGRGPVTKGM